MDNGFYATKLANSDARAGITVIEDSCIRGGDSQFLYSGTITLSATTQEVVANIKITAYKNAINEPFGTKDEPFELSLLGERTGQGFRMTGYSPSGKEIVIDAYKLANIDLTVDQSDV